MPKCLNDSKKSYTGKEPSPKGLGYSASSECTGKTMKGKDETMWIVTETKTCKKWMKLKIEKDIEIDFNKLSKDFYTNAYIPTSIQIKFEDETGLEDKFGGSKPFFIEGESWPVDDDYIPMRFFCQFKDPRKSDNYLYRVFLPIDNKNDILVENTYINKIELNKENIKNQIIIEEKLFEKFEPFKITCWKITKELKSYEYILSQFNIVDNSESNDKYWDKYYDSIYSPSHGNKIGGTPVYTQCAYDIEKNPKLLQITGSRELPYEWGDAGIAHISEDLKLDWDCC
jgi:uncharacterized protein YwqG